jgi:hypothetical protein
VLFVKTLNEQKKIIISDDSLKRGVAEMMEENLK